MITEHLETQTRHLENLEDRIAANSERLRALQEAEPLFSHRLTASSVKWFLLEDEDSILTNEIFGMEAPVFDGMSRIVVSERYVAAAVNDSIIGEQRSILLSYEVVGIGEFASINWTLVDTCGFLPSRYLQPRIPRDLYPDQTTIPVQFPYRHIVTDPGRDVTPKFMEDPIEIPGQYFFDEFIRLMHEHTGIVIWDMWLESGKIYVDLHSTEMMFFNRGTTGSTHRGNMLILTLSQLPGIYQFELLVGGERGVEVDHFFFGRGTFVGY